MNDHRQARLSTPIGILTLVATERGLSRVRFAHQDASDVDAAVDGQHPVLAAAASQLREYFAGRRTRFDLALDLVSGLARCFLVPGADGDVNAFAGKLLCYGAADAPRGAGNDGFFASQAKIHGDLLPVLSQ